MKKLLAMVLALMMVLSIASALADYPEHEINLIIPYGEGGTTDVYARKLGILLEKQLNVKLVPKNITGASGSSGSQYVLDQPADGYTLLVCAETMGTYRTMNVAQFGYDDFTVITPLVGDPKIIVVSKDSPYQTMQELLDAIKANPGELTMSHSGPGGSGHNQGLVLGQFGYEVTMVNSQSGNNALMDVKSGEVDFTNPNISTLPSYLESGELRPLAVFSNARLAAYPEIPAITEFLPEVENYVNIPYTVLSLLIGKDTPAEIVETVKTAVAAVMEDPDWTDFVTANAADPLYAMYPDADSANAFYQHWVSVVTWMQYDNEVAPKSPEEFGIPRP